MSVVRNVVVPAAIATAVGIPIAINHDEAMLDHRRSPVGHAGEFIREHTLGFMVASGLVGAGITALALKSPQLGQRLLAAGGGTAAGIVIGHYAWDGYLAHVEGQSRPAAPAAQ